MSVTLMRICRYHVPRLLHRVLDCTSHAIGLQSLPVVTSHMSTRPILHRRSLHIPAILFTDGDESTLLVTAVVQFTMWCTCAWASKSAATHHTCTSWVRNNTCKQVRTGARTCTCDGTAARRHTHLVVISLLDPPDPATNTVHTPLQPIYPSQSV